MKSIIHPQMSSRLINGSYITLILYFSATVFIICIGSVTILITIHSVHLDRVYDEAKFCIGGWGKLILIYHIIDRLSRISK